MTQPLPLVVVLGPTGSGKSRLAMDLGSQFRGEIISCDSVQVHRGLDIGSAKIPVAERLAIPHHLIDAVDPGDELTAGAYARLARQILQEVSARGALPIVAGGTGFYLRALLDGLSPAPQRDSAMRGRLQRLAGRRPGALHRFLRRFDPGAALRIHPNDHQKLIRAVELTIRSNQPASKTQAAPRASLQGYSVFKVGLAPNRAALYESLDRRSAGLFRSGLLEETKQLLTCISPGAKALGSLGYKQAVQILTLGMPLEEAIRECQTRTRQYAKRQLTWFRREQDVHWLHGFGTDQTIRQRASRLVGDFLISRRLLR